MPTLLQRIDKAMKAFRFAGSGGQAYGTGYPGWGGLYNFAPGTRFDYVSEAGDLWQSSIVLANINWATRTFPEAPLMVEERQGDKWSEVPFHPLTELIRRPNPYYSGMTLFAGTLLSLIVDGNAYWVKDRNGRGEVVRLNYVPHFMIGPRWPDDGSEFISDYAYRVDGRLISIKPQNVVHFRHGIDPRNYRRGLSPLAAAYREVVTDNEAATFAAATLRNMGIPGVVISPKNPEDTFDTPTRESIVAKWIAKFTGERRGEPFVPSVPMDVTVPGFSPQQMDISNLRMTPEERICALIGLSPMVIGLGAGLDRSTFTNYAEARRAAYESFIMPIKALIADELDLQLLADLGDADGERVGFDYSKVTALQDDKSDLIKNITLAVGGPWLTPNEAREKLELPPISGGEELVKPEPPILAPGGAEKPLGKQNGNGSTGRTQELAKNGSGN